MAKWVINFNLTSLFSFCLHKSAKNCKMAQLTADWEIALVARLLCFLSAHSLMLGVKNGFNHGVFVQGFCRNEQLNSLFRSFWFYLWRCFTTFESVCCVVWTCLPGIPGMNTWCSATFTYCCVLVWSVQCFHILCSSPFYIGKHCPNSAVYRRGNCSLIPDIGCLQPKSKIRYIQEFYLPHKAKIGFFLKFCFLYQTLCS